MIAFLVQHFSVKPTLVDANAQSRQFSPSLGVTVVVVVGTTDIRRDKLEVCHCVSWQL